MTALPGDEWVRDSPCCQAPMERDVGADDADGVVRAVLRCTACPHEWVDEGPRWTPAEIRRAVRQVTAAQRWGEL